MYVQRRLLVNQDLHKECAYKHLHGFPAKSERQASDYEFLRNLKRPELVDVMTCRQG